MIRLCINTQTPPLYPLPGAPTRSGATWKFGIDYTPQLGGVVPMMRALLKTGAASWIAPNPRWVALGGPGIPREVRTDEGYIVETIDLPDDRRAAYGRFKEAIWRSFHAPEISDTGTIADYRAFVEYSVRTADALLAHANEYDLFFINDFQQLLVGGLIGSAAPALLRWHIPMELRGYPEPVRHFLLKAMEGFDAIVVSTRAGLEELIRAGFHGRAFQIYPYIDPQQHRAATDSMVRAFREKHRLGVAPFVFSVSRMDPVKRQDLLIAAFQHVHKVAPDARLVLAGGGSFSTHALTGKGRRSKSDVWSTDLQRQVRAAGLEGFVQFTGYLEPDELRAAYRGASVFVHPAPWEGFGLVVIEAWSQSTPVVVSRGSGVAELVDDGINGFTVPPGSVAGLAARMTQLLRRPEAADRMGVNGALTARQCHVQRAAPRLKEIWERTIELYTSPRFPAVSSYRL